MRKTIDVHRLLHDLGGPAYIAETLGLSRSTPYQWLHRGRISAVGVNLLLGNRAELGVPDLDLSAYLTEA